MCESCQSTALAFDWQVMSGRGRVQTWTIVRRALLPAFAADVPYTIVQVELDERAGLILVGQLRGVDEADIELDMPVQVTFSESSPGVSVPHFETVRA